MQQLFIKLQHCRQGARLVEEYVVEFYSLVARNQLNETEAQLLASFIDGLNNLIQQGMTQSVFTMVEAFQQATKVERRVHITTRQATLRQARYHNYYKASMPYNSYSGNQGERGSTVTVDPHKFSYGQSYQTQQQPLSFSFAQPTTTPTTSPILPSTVAPQSIQQQSKPTSDKFSNRTQQQFPPLTKAPNIYSKFRGDKCNKCNQSGYSSDDCRRFNGFIGDNQLQIDSQDDEVFNEDASEEVDDLDLHDSHGDHFVGMIRPFMLTEPCYSQRHSIFKTKCFIGGKVCDMIIDSGSVDNYIASVVVEKMGLPTTPHPSPYSVGWVNSSSTQRITHQCVIEYKESVLCDVIDMTATHLLLGRPWKYDVGEVHNCFENTYTFYKDGKRVILFPSKSSLVIQERSDCKTTALVATISRSLHSSHTLSSHEGTKPMVTIPTQVQPLLSKFKALFPEELPVSLPPFRDVQHCIDFIPGVVLPNQAHYRLSPTEHEILQVVIIRLESEWVMNGKLLSKQERGYMNGLLCLLVFKVLYENSLFMNLKKCTFMSSKVTFLGYLISSKGIHVDPSKVQAIMDWPVPTSIKEVRSFHGLASFYRRFVRNFSTIAAPLTDCLKKEKFIWTEEADNSFNALKEKLCSTPILALPDFSKPFQVDCDASIIGIGTVLSHEGHPVAYHSEKNSGTQKKWSTYELELLALVQALKQWHTYLIHQEFVINTDNHALKYLRNSSKVNRMHDRWLSTINKYTFSVKHKSGKLNQVADALSRRRHILATIRN
ncbi:uncharacterized protein LOC113326491 [Papaver somniferum]|uniref:uncharacterized protein LOC113326491 n=1 Tax=Papaver somniferum TaxID=3469 RepID=UPI000E6F8B44|nr:uncharacterized protein LOC113326491 [Papaver somniferum]